MKSYAILASFAFVLSNALFAVTPTEALQKLVEGNNRYVEDRLLHPDRTTERREATAAGQEPFAAILGCSDSRVPPEIVFDQGVGDLFVVRVAGNVVGPVELDSLEYAVKYLHSSIIVVLGHAKCGAMKAVLEGNTADIEAVADLIEPMIQTCKSQCKSCNDLLDICVKENAKHVAKVIREKPLMKKYIEEQKIDVVAGYYDLATGKVEILKD